MTAIRNADDRLEYVSSSWAHFAGTTAAQSLNRRRLDFVHPEGLHLVEQLAQARNSVEPQAEWVNTSNEVFSCIE